MRLLILGEGTTDLGHFTADGEPTMDGVLPILVRKLLTEASPGAAVEIRVKELSKVRVLSSRQRGIGRTQHGYAAKLRILLGLKEGRDADAIIAVVDRDYKYPERLDELNAGRDEVTASGKKCAVGMAIEEIEAWLLADETALRAGLGDETIQRQPDPERLDSSNDSSDRNPRGRLINLHTIARGAAPETGDFPEFYAAIANAIQLQVLIDRCCDGFAPFAKQVRELAQ